MASMKRILLVEDDVVIARIYARKLEDAGFRVLLAADGLSAIKLIPIFLPDLVVLDIMLPKLSGVEVLKYLRAEPAHKSVQVVVLSNAFLNTLWDEITALGVQEILLKSSVSPPQLVQVVQRFLKGSAPAVTTAKKTTVTNAESGKPAKKSDAAGAAAASRRISTSREPAAAAAVEPGESSKPPRRSESEVGFRRRIRRDFLDQIPDICQGLDQACREFLEGQDPPTQLSRLEELRRKVGFLTHMTGMAGWQRLAQLSSAFEALLYELQVKPGALKDSARHTIASTVRLLTDCLAGGDGVDERWELPTTVLVVDDDAVSTRALVMTLEHAQVNATSVSEPFDAIEKLRQNAYDVTIIDINLPGMSGLSLCEHMRKLPLHARTPVIFITGYAEFEARARAVLGTGDDLIGKPIMPIELTVKVLAHVLARRLDLETAPA
jgi:CheY-like chemotaxis protein